MGDYPKLHVNSGWPRWRQGGASISQREIHVRIRDQIPQVFDSYLSTHLRFWMSEKDLGEIRYAFSTNLRLDKGAVDWRKAGRGEEAVGNTEVSPQQPPGALCN